MVIRSDASCVCVRRAERFALRALVSVGCALAGCVDEGPFYSRSTAAAAPSCSEEEARCEGGERPCGPGLQRLGNVCADIDECAATPGPCPEHSVCFNRPGSFACSCSTGYLKRGLECQDVDECAEGTADCGPASACTNLIGSYACTCHVGIAEDGRCRAPPLHATGRLTVGSRHACHIDERGRLHCWGSNLHGQLGDGPRIDVVQPVRVDVAGSDSGWLAAAAGAHHTCAVQDGDLFCWGANEWGQLGDGSTDPRGGPGAAAAPSGWHAVDSGSAHTCALRSGELWCWGANDRGQLGDGTGEARSAPVQIGSDAHWTSVSAGHAHTCAAAEDAIRCWGANDAGQLGNDSYFDARGPVDVMPATGARVSAGGFHTCALAGGALACWGQNDEGQLGDGTTESRAVPGPPIAESDWVAVAAGVHHTCAIRYGGSLWCWGANGRRQLGIGHTQSQTSPQQLPFGHAWESIDAGEADTCAAREGQRRCWGGDAMSCSTETGQCDDIDAMGGPSDPGPWPDAAAPAAVAVATAFQHVSVGAEHTCGIVGGRRWCWGEGGMGALGDGTLYDSAIPEPADGATDWSALASGATHACGLRDGGALYCWGYQEAGLGDGSTIREAPVRIGAVFDWTAVATGNEHTCGLHGEGALLCWGSNARGQLGDGTLEPRAEPAPTAPDLVWDAIAAGAQHSCGISEGAVLCWGRGADGQIGDGGRVDRHEPTGVPIATASPCDAIAAGNNWTSCALFQGELHCWGGSPRQIPTPSAWRTVAVGFDRTFGIADDGSLWFWPNPVDPYGNAARYGTETWDFIAARASHFCAARSGALHCWGRGASGQLGNGQ